MEAGLSVGKVPALADRSILASNLDLIEVIDLSPEIIAGLDASRRDFTMRGENVYAVPVDTTAWSSAPEALGEPFATKFFEPGATGKCAAITKASRKSKKDKDAAEWSAEEALSAEEVFPASRPMSSKSSRRSRRRPASTGSLRRGSSKGRLLECSPCSLSCDDLARPPQSRKTLTPLPKVPECQFPNDQLSNEGENECPRPQSAPASEQTIARIADADLWNIGFNDNDGYNDPCIWDCDREIFSAWGGTDDCWADDPMHESDWGDDNDDALEW
jgi:hypothetical protein